MERRTVEATEQDNRARAHAASFRLIVQGGPDSGKEVWVHAATPSPVRIGSSRACELALSDRKISRRHLSLECQSGSLRVADLGSTNGTTVNGLTIEAAILRGGEVVRIGDTALWVEAQASSPQAALSERRSFGRVVGASLGMRRLYPALEGLASSGVNVIIEGETGTGKELLAEALHDAGPRASGPFIAIDVNETDTKSLERELFGIVDGPSGHKGAFEEADHGTLLIDDVAELPLPIQARLLRAIERREIVRARGTEVRQVDVRLLVATRHDLDRAVENGNFREDLFHHLAVARIELPPLRRREDDIALLADHFWRELDRSGAPFPADLLQHDGYHWPGNVRELKNLVTRRFVTGTPLRDTPRPPRPPGEAETTIIDRVVDEGLSFTEARERVIAEFERVYVTKTLDRYAGNVTKAAATSGIARRYFHRLKARHAK